MKFNEAMEILTSKFTSDNGIPVEHNTITVEEWSAIKKELEGLESDVSFLRALEATGVDNWSGYDIARALHE